MLLDCVMYHNDVATFKMRHDYLKQFNVQHIVVEADRTHSGKPKELNFRRYFPDVDCIYGVVHLPETDDRWFLENTHRQGLNQAIRQFINRDCMVMISDCDEIPNLESWYGNEGVFYQRMSFYTPYLTHPDPWRGTVIMNSLRFNSIYGAITAQDCRNFRDVLMPVGTGWHLSWLGSKEWCETKADNFAHSEITKGIYNSAVLEHRAPDGTLLTEDYNVPNFIKINYENIIKGELK